MFGLTERLYWNAAVSDLLEGVAQRYWLLKFLTVQGSFDAQVLGYVEKGGIENLFDLRFARLVDFRSRHMNKTIEPHIKISTIFHINVESVESLVYSAECGWAVVITLNVINSIVSPLITIALYVHIALPLSASNVTAVMGAFDFLLIHIFWKEVSKFGVAIGYLISQFG